MTAEDNEWIRSVTLDVSLIYGCGCDAADQAFIVWFEIIFDGGESDLHVTEMARERRESGSEAKQISGEDGKKKSI